MVARTRVCRTDVLMYRPLPVVQRRGQVLELARLIPAAGVSPRGVTLNAAISDCATVEPLGDDDGHNVTVTCSAAVNDACAGAGKSGEDMADSHSVTCNAAISECEQTWACEQEEWLSDKIRTKMRADVLNAMPYEVVSGPQCAWHHADAVKEIASHIRSAAAGAPAGVHQRIIAHASEDAERILDAAADRKGEIAKRLQAAWPRLQATDKSPWEARHLEALRTYDIERRHYENGRRQDEPKRPAGAYFLWMQDRLLHEWNSQRIGIESSSVLH